jgi:L-arabinonolactonase
MRLHQAVSVASCQNLLGEACIWNAGDDSVWWADIEARQVLRLDGDARVHRFDLPDRPAFVFPRPTGGFVVGFPTSIAIADDSFTSFRWVADIEPEQPQTRVNDATIDPWGGIIVGTYNQIDRQPVGGVYRVTPGGRVTKLLGGIAAANGLAFSPDGSFLHVADTAEGTIRRFAVGNALSAISELAPLAPADIAPGSPDGATVDSDGGYWITRLRGGCVVRIAPDGVVTDRVDLPTMTPTCATFGGRDLGTLFITSRRVRQPAEELERLPQSGDLFAISLPFRGATSPDCAV